MQCFHHQDTVASGERDHVQLCAECLMLYAGPCIMCGYPVVNYIAITLTWCGQVVHCECDDAHADGCATCKDIINGRVAAMVNAVRGVYPDRSFGDVEV